MMAQEDGAVSFDLAYSCGETLTLEIGLAQILASYIAGIFLGLLRAARRSIGEESGGLLTLRISTT